MSVTVAVSDKTSVCLTAVNVARLEQARLTLMLTALSGKLLDDSMVRFFID